MDSAMNIVVGLLVAVVLYLVVKDWRKSSLRNQDGQNPVAPSDVEDPELDLPRKGKPHVPDPKPPLDIS